ncbi:MAG: hypothetical protein HZA60_02740 [Deltaproteobacteria bacterium]|nr:hypothetical protein [Deltaproteobacteria bacterium]
MRANGKPGAGIVSPPHAARMESVLATYHQATIDLVSALKRADPEAACEAMEARARCIEEYASEMDLLHGCPASERDPALIEKLRWHHLRINEADADAIRYIRSLQDEVREQLVQVGLARKIGRLYQPPPSEKIRIVNGES